MAYKQIGIVGGVGPSATILYYQQIIESFREREGGENFPEIYIHSLDLGEIHGLFDREEYDLLSNKLISAVKGLEMVGCDFALFSCNAMHIVFDRVCQNVNVPMVSLIQAVMDQVNGRNLKTVGLMGTTIAMRGGLYREPLKKSGVTCLLPDEGEQNWIMDAIMGDLQLSAVPESTVRRLHNNAVSLEENGAEAVILGCTDLPVAINEETSPIPVLDSTKIHVNAIVDFALGTN